MLILKKPASVEIFIKGSRFLAEVVPVESVERAKEILHAKRELYIDANHVVYAFIVGTNGEVMGCSDAGEPSGTAGKPTLAVVKGSGITNFILTTTRWFGGTKLGTGGLVHAYSDCAKAVLEMAETSELIAMKDFEFTISYTYYEQVKRFLSTLLVENLQDTFTDNIALSGQVKEQEYSQLANYLNELTNGRCQLN